MLLSSHRRPPVWRDTGVKRGNRRSAVSRCDRSDSDSEGCDKWQADVRAYVCMSERQAAAARRPDAYVSGFIVSRSWPLDFGSALALISPLVHASRTDFVDSNDKNVCLDGKIRLVAPTRWAGAEAQGTNGPRAAQAALTSFAAWVAGRCTA